MKKKAMHEDPYAAVIDAFNHSAVHYIVVGMSGINYYAKNPAHLFSTLDYDIFLEPVIRNVEKAVACLKPLGFSMATTEGALDEKNIKNMVRAHKTIVATTPDGFMVELLLKVSGYSFEEMVRDASVFSVGETPIKVGQLAKLLESKQLANRPKDRHFLKRFKLMLDHGI